MGKVKCFVLGVTRYSEIGNYADVKANLSARGVKFIKKEIKLERKEKQNEMSETDGENKCFGYEGKSESFLIRNGNRERDYEPSDNPNYLILNEEIQ